MTLEEAEFDKANRQTFSSAAVAQHYVAMTSLFAPEARALGKIRALVRDQPIMDVGVGTGRTTPYLLELSKDYLGLDYSAEMIGNCRSRFPGVKFEVADARRLDSYPRSHFALLLFSLNGIDCVQHADRMQILRECHCLVRDNGFFLFSSHNDLWELRAGQPLARRVLGRVKDSIRYLRHLGRVRPFRNETQGFSYRCDLAIGNTRTLLLYYVRPQAQLAQLRSVGFRCEAIFNPAGDELRPGMGEASPSPWLYYLARKTPAV